MTMIDDCLSNVLLNHPFHLYLHFHLQQLKAVFVCSLLANARGLNH